MLTRSSSLWTASSWAPSHCWNTVQFCRRVPTDVQGTENTGRAAGTKLASSDQRQRHPYRHLHPEDEQRQSRRAGASPQSEAGAARRHDVSCSSSTNAIVPHSATCCRTSAVPSRTRCIFGFTGTPILEENQKKNSTTANGVRPTASTGTASPTASATAMCSASTRTW